MAFTIGVAYVEEVDVAGNRQTSFLKRQKEQKRTARATEKREARRLKKSGKETENHEEAGDPELAPLDEAVEGETEGDEAGEEKTTDEP